MNQRLGKRSIPCDVHTQERLHGVETTGTKAVTQIQMESLMVKSGGNYRRQEWFELQKSKQVVQTMIPYVQAVETMLLEGKMSMKETRMMDGGGGRRKKMIFLIRVFCFFQQKTKRITLLYLTFSRVLLR